MRSISVKRGRLWRARRKSVRRLHDRSKQKYLDVVVRSLRDTLEKGGIGEILEVKGGFIRIRPELIDCDLYRLLEGDENAVSSYRGDYLCDYPWAVLDARAIP